MKQLFKRLTCGAMAVLTVLLMAVAALPAPRAVANSGETYTWKTNTTIEVSGGVLSGPQTLTSSGANTQGFGGILAHRNGCNFKINLLVGTPNSGFVSFPQVIGNPGQGNGVTNPCPADLIQSFAGQTAITGTRPGPGDTPETATQRNIFVTVNSPNPSSESPATVIATLNNAGGKQLKQITMQKEEFAQDGDNPADRVVSYKGAFTDIDPGNYQVCLNVIDTNCKSVSKVKYQSPSLNFGESLAARNIIAKLELSWSGPAEARRIGPATVVLKKGGAEVAHVETNEIDYTPTAEQEQANGLITIDFTFPLEGTLTNIEAGEYDICVSGTKVCKHIVKEDGLNLTVNLKVDGADAAALILGALDDEEHPVCQSSSSALSWLLCPLVNGLGEAADWIMVNIIVPFMRPSPVGLDPNDKATGAVYQIWSTMRIYADIILVILLLIAVISQAYGGGIVEVYTATKMLPRILVGAILINTSIYIVASAIDMSNVIGAGIADIITAPLVQTGNFTFSPTNEQAFAITGIAAAIGAITVFLVTSGLLMAILPFVLLFLVLPAFLALLTVMVILIFLQGLYMALTIFSPIAFALYAFPNTQKYFQRWWDWLLRALLVYPLYMTVVAIADVFSVLIQKANGG